MKCGDYEGVWSNMARGPCAVGLQLSFGGSRGVPLAVSSRLPRKPACPVVLETPPNPRVSPHALPSDTPFISDMDEISYWIHTKRAPCLMNYDNLIKKQSEEAQCSKTVNEDLPSPRKRKKKRKLSMLDDDSVSTVKQQNVYFEVSQRKHCPVVDNCKSDSLGSDIDLNNQNTAIREKPKRAKLQKNIRTKIHKKAKPLVTSTPKPNVHLRRSLRQAKRNSNAHLDSSFEILINSIVSNGHLTNNIHSNQKPDDRVESTQFLPGSNQLVDNKRNTSQKIKSKNTTNINGPFEDMSDVSGFTANYIRSTKVQSSKTPRKIRCKSSRNLVKDSQQSSQGNMVVCVNKSINTGLPQKNAVNCSTDSSQNVINLVTSNTIDKSAKVDKSTSLLKFVDTKAKSKEAPAGKDACKQKNKANLNISFQSQSSGTSRYPKRRNRLGVNANSAGDDGRCKKMCIEFNNSDKKENPQETAVSRTRSGRNISLTARQIENSVLVISNSTEQVSSMVSMNVASPAVVERRKKRRTARQVQVKKSLNKSGQSLRRDSLRDKSGFAACFSESDDDSVPLMQRKYFCN